MPRISAEEKERKSFCDTVKLEKLKCFLSNCEYFAHYNIIYIISESKGLKESLTTTNMTQKMDEYVKDLSTKFEDLKKDVKMELDQSSSSIVVDSL